MRTMFRILICQLAIGLTGSATATAAPFTTRPTTGTTAIEVDESWFADPLYYDEYDLPPPPVEVVPAPPIVVYEPPVYGWISPPPRPASCGKYRYWNGDYCADARDDPPYTGPRW